MKQSSQMMSNVTDFRKKARLTQEQLANEVDVTRQTIISIEKGNYVPSVLLALKIAKVFETTVEEMFYYEVR